jgi:hypothetical protein
VNNIHQENPMKFLVFNIVVAGSLYYLMTADDINISQLENQTQEAVAKVGEWTQEKVIKPGQQAVSAAKANLEKSSSPQPETADGESKPIETRLAEKLETEEKATAADEPQTSSNQDNQSSIITQESQPQKQPPAAPEQIATIPVTDPRVAKRRDEILNNNAMQTPIRIAEGHGMMSSVERRRELQALAEDMEFRFIQWSE